MKIQVEKMKGRKITERKLAGSLLKSLPALREKKKKKKGVTANLNPLRS